MHRRSTRIRCPRPMSEQRVLSPAQFREAMAADSRLALHAVLHGARIPGLTTMLAGADVLDWDCLWPGALPESQRRQAPFLARLRPGSPFTDWILFRASQEHAEWGLMVMSAARFLDLRAHLRELRTVQLPDGQRAPLAFMDPEVMRLLLPLLDLSQLAEVMRPQEAWFLPDAQGWTRYLPGAARLEQLSLRIAA